jgi:hypothetical protein
MISLITKLNIAQLSVCLSGLRVGCASDGKILFMFEEQAERALELFCHHGAAEFLLIFALFPAEKREMLIKYARRVVSEWSERKNA